MSRLPRETHLFKILEFVLPLSEASIILVLRLRRILRCLVLIEKRKTINGFENKSHNCSVFILDFVFLYPLTVSNDLVWRL